MELYENWTETKEALLEGLTESKKKILAPLMENQKRYLSEDVTGGTSMSAISDFRKIMMPMLRRIIPASIGPELVGTQPMSGPVGLAYSLRFLFDSAITTPGGTNDVPLQSSFPLGDGNNEIWGTDPILRRFYSGGETGIDPVTGLATTFGTAGTTQGFAATSLEAESKQGRNLRLEVLKQTITAGSRKLQAKWSVEAMQDLNSQHGLDLEAEITAALSAEIVSEIDNEIITDLTALAGTTDTFSFAATGSIAGNYAPTFVGDRFAGLGVIINKVANEIARKTRRGAGNWIVVSPLIVSVLQSATKSVFAPAIAGSFEGPNNTKLAGTLNGSIKVYTYLYADVYAGEDETILMGYKGGTGEMDCGYFYCPYIPLMSTNVIIDPQTYNPQVQLSTRYGKATFKDNTTSLGNSADYYARINAAGIAFV